MTAGADLPEGFGDADVERALRSEPTPRPGSEFRARMRHAFVSGEVAAQDSEDDGVLPSRAAAGVRNDSGPMFERTLNVQPIAPEADSAFRADLREAFVSGGLAEEYATGQHAAGDSLEESRSRPDRTSTGWPTSLRLLLPLAAAAAAILLVLNFERGARWSVRSLAGEGVVRVDGAPRGTVEPVGAIVAKALPGGARIESRNHRLLLELDGNLRLQLEPDTTVIFGADASDRAGGDLEVELVAGRLIGSTGPDYRSEKLVVRTDRGVATVVGTTFAIDALDVGSCFCVAEGLVRLRSVTDDELLEVATGESTFLFTAGGRSQAQLGMGGGHLGNAEQAAEHGRTLREFEGAFGY